MKIKTKALAALLLAVALLALPVLSSCTSCKQEEKKPEVSGLETIHETEFGGVYLKMTIDEFNKLGFVYGDSVDVEFSNGYKLEDIPYYNGYYVDAGEPLLIAYPGYDYIKAAINYGEDLWEKAGLLEELHAVPQLLQSKETDLFKAANLDGKSTAKVVLRERGKYLAIQRARDIHYSDERTKYPSDEAFANFRNMTVGELATGAVYRAASPCDNQHNRAPYVDALIKKAGVNCIMNLADNEAKLEKYIHADGFNSPYFLSLYQANKVLPLALNMNYLSADFAEKIAKGFTEMAEFEPPYLIHCTEGKDRTGFVCMLIAMLADASYEEIVDDYMLTYDNYYKINPTLDPERYEVIKAKNIDEMLLFVTGEKSLEDLKKSSLRAAAERFLKGAGMTEEAIRKLEDRITGK